MNDVQQLYRPVSLLPALPRYLPEQEYDCDEYIWWEEQRRRFEKGWVAPDGKFINGIYYLYLNFLKINIGDEDKGEKVVANPLYFEEDNDLLDLVWFGIGRGIKKPAKKIVVTKGRRQHFSENMHSAVLIWFLLVKTGRPIAITYPDDTYKLKTKKKFDFTLANAPDELFYKFYQGRHCAGYCPTGAEPPSASAGGGATAKPADAQRPGRPAHRSGQAAAGTRAGHLAPGGARA